MQAPCENRRDSDAQPHEALIRKKSLLTIHSFFAVLVMMFVVTFIVVIGIDFFGGWAKLQGNSQSYVCPVSGAEHQLSLCYKS